MGVASHLLCHGLTIALLAAPAAASEPVRDWRGWGGPTHDFRAPAEGIATVWPADGPKRLWKRELGDGFSAVLVEGGRLYTMYRGGDREAIVALDAATGRTIWERRYEHDPHEGYIADRGNGPRSTPLVAGDRIYAIGVAGRMHCLDKADGTVLWSHELWGEPFGGTVLQHGYASSPIEYGDTVIALVGGEGKGIVAFDKEDGNVVWSSLDLANSYSTPQVMRIGGQEQLVTFMADRLVGVDPGTGELLWSHPVENQYGENISPPILVEDRYLFMSSVQVGSRGLELTRDEAGKTEVAELWSTRRVQLYHVTGVAQGDIVYGSSGARAPHFLSAINVKTGEIAWRKRGFAKVNIVRADGRLILLDENGTVHLTTASADDLTVHSSAEVLESLSWTAPTIVGSTMYVRDRTHVTAVDLSPQASAEAIAVATAAPSDAEAAPAASTEPTPSPIDPDEPEAIRILRRADAAARSIESVRYRAVATPNAGATWIPATEGEMIIAGWDGMMPERFRGRVTTVLSGSDERVALTGGGDGETYFLIDHRAKKAYADIDPNVLGAGRRALGAVQLTELVHPTPFADEIGAESVELKGEAEVGGVPCFEIRVAYGGGFGESIWFISKDDFLPRRKIRIFGGADATFDVTLTDVEVNPELAPGLFRFEAPKGYETIHDFAP